MIKKFPLLLLLLGCFVSVVSQAQIGTLRVSGGALTGNGNIDANVVIAEGGTLAPGDAGESACLSISSLTLEAGSTLALDVADGAACDNYDQLVVAESTSIENGILEVNSDPAYQPSVGEQITLISNSASVATGAFLSLEQGATVSVGGIAMTVEYDSGAGGDVTLSHRLQPARPHLTVVEGFAGEIRVFFAPQTGGIAPVRFYTLTCADAAGNQSSVSGQSSPLVLSGFDAFESYDCSVTARSVAGVSYAATSLVEVLQDDSNLIELFAAFCQSNPEQCN